ncbi:MAG: ferritin family protein [Syntrophales bacterium]|nr:ferritin family protein [Syntrophales bacterium]
MEERLKALEVALKNEHQEYEFYMKQAARTTNPLGKKMFELIAADEKEHCQRIGELYEVWKNNAQWPETVPLSVRGEKVGQHLRGVIDNLKDANVADTDDRRALEIAIEFEANGAVYYARLRDEVEDPREKAFFNLLSDMEHEHFVVLKELLEFFEDPSSWYRKVERTGLDGA